MSDNNKTNNNNIPFICNHQLSKKNQYNIEVLEHNIGNLGLRKILQTQILTPDFCVKYILNPEEHGMCREDQYFCDFDILKYQPHITKEQLINARNNLTN